MSRFPTVIASLLLSLPALALAQPGPPAAPPPTASAPGLGPGWRAGPGNTPGWSLMTPAERQRHHERMAAMRNYEECHDYMKRHHQDMVERAKERGIALRAKPRRDACVRLKNPA